MFPCNSFIRPGQSIKKRFKMYNTTLSFFFVFVLATTGWFEIRAWWTNWHSCSNACVYDYNPAFSCLLGRVGSRVSPRAILGNLKNAPFIRQQVQVNQLRAGLLDVLLQFVPFLYSISMVSVTGYNHFTFITRQILSIRLGSARLG